MFGIHIPDPFKVIDTIAEEAKKIAEDETKKVANNCTDFAEDTFGDGVNFTKDNVKPLINAIEANVKPMAKAFAENHPLLDTLMDQFRDMSMHDKFKRKLKKASSHVKIAASILEGFTGIFAEKATTVVFDSWDDIDSFIDRQNEDEIKIAYYIYCSSFGTVFA